MGDGDKTARTGDRNPRRTDPSAQPRESRGSPDAKQQCRRTECKGEAKDRMDKIDRRPPWPAASRSGARRVRRSTRRSRARTRDPRAREHRRESGGRSFDGDLPLCDRDARRRSATGTSCPLGARGLLTRPVGLGILVDEIPPAGDGEQSEHRPLDGVGPAEPVARQRPSRLPPAGEDAPGSDDRDLEMEQQGSAGRTSAVRTREAWVVDDPLLPVSGSGLASTPLASNRLVIFRSATNAQNGTVPASSTSAICHLGTEPPCQLEGNVEIDEVHEAVDRPDDVHDLGAPGRELERYADEDEDDEQGRGREGHHPIAHEIATSDRAHLDGAGSRVRAHVRVSALMSARLPGPFQDVRGCGNREPSPFAATWKSGTASGSPRSRY